MFNFIKSLIIKKFSFVFPIKQNSFAFFVFIFKTLLNDKLNNSIWNLEWVTCSENRLHAMRIGLVNIKGENHNLATITDKQAEDICRLLSTTNYTRQQIADIVGCTIYNINNIVGGNCRKEVREKYGIEKSYSHTDKDLVKNICILFEKNCHLFENKYDLFKHTAKILGVDYSESIARSMYRIYTRYTHTDISKDYKF